MKQTNARQIHCYIKTLSPIHIGCDEVYEPTGFVLDKPNKHLTVFEAVDFVRALSPEDRDRFAQICRQGTISSLIEIYKFMKNRPIEGRRVNVCDDFILHYDQVLSIPANDQKKIQQELNKFEIPRTSFLPKDKRPYLPGSSIKGALRTGYLNFQEKLKGLAKSKRQFKKASDLEHELMDFTGIKDDPFRMVKVSDFMPVGDVTTRIVYAVNIKKAAPDKQTRGLPLLFEVIPAGAEFQGVITVEEPANGSGIKQPVKLMQLMDGVSAFYVREKVREEREIDGIGTAALDTVSKEGVLIRCGRHSGAECVTIEGHRQIRIMGKRGEKPADKKGATTIWPASEKRRPGNLKNLNPFGWAAICVKSEEDQAKFDSRERAYTKAQDEKRRQQNEAALEKERANQQKIAQEKLQAEEAEKEKLVRKQREAELAAMSPEEREVEEITASSVTEEKVNIVFKKIGGYPEKMQKKAAGLIKAFWQENNNWEKSDFSTKQWKKARERIQEIKNILGES